MSQNTTGTSTMSKTPNPKVVSKKTKAPAPVAAAAPVVEEKAAKKAKPSVAPVPVAAAPVVSAVAEQEGAVEVKSVEQEISALIVSHQKIRDEAVANIKTLQRLQKRGLRLMLGFGPKSARLDHSIASCGC